MIRNKGYFEKMLGANPDLSQGLVFFPDETGFSSLLLYGIEWHLLVLYMALFGLLDILLDCPIEAGVIVYAVDVFVRMARRHFGEKNISNKSLLDSKFLL
jgi:meckelin